MSDPFRDALPPADVDPDDIDTVVLVLGDQLDPDHPGLKDADPDHTLVAMIEAHEEATHVPSHRQRTVLFLSAMRHYAVDLADKGWTVNYQSIGDEDPAGSFDEGLGRVIDLARPERVCLARPGDWRVMEKIDRWRDQYARITFDVLEDPHFYINPEEYNAWAEGLKRPVLENFYRMMRKRFEVLVDDDHNPAGGEWNFDKENREPYRGDRSDIPSPRTFRPDAITQQVIDQVEALFPDAPGRITNFTWPVTRREALAALRDFIEHRLPDFGRSQDAMVADQPWMFHARLGAALNLKLINPRDCVQRAVEAWENDEAPIAAVEGFVRQLLGWREFLRGVYWHQG
ncbi:MAG: cryptochrome/photolyase family protein, partial [Phycisphaeraceae bacterium]|nr:cryptochrome/photolyase family protein [Phycisphaeraceae bacterium]